MNAEKYNVMNRSRLPFSLWSAIHACYEWSLIVNTVVVLAFWFLEGPFIIYNLAWTTKTPYSMQFMYYFDHTVPYTLLIFDWWHCSIRVGFGRIWLYLMVSAAYCGVLIHNSLWNGYGTIYYSMNFAYKPYRASFFLCLI